MGACAQQGRAAAGMSLTGPSGSKLGQSPRESHLKLTCHSLVCHLHPGFCPENRTITIAHSATYVWRAGLRNRGLQVRVLPGAFRKLILSLATEGRYGCHWHASTYITETYFILDIRHRRLHNPAALSGTPKRFSLNWRSAKHTRS